MSIPQSFIQELLARADVVDIVGRYVQLRKGGANYLGLCPFHGEKTPSFTVSPAKQFYHCFGCGKNGNAIGFLMDYAGMNFVEAVKDLAGQYGMQVPEDDRSPADRARAAEERQKHVTLTDVLEKAGAAYRKHLRGSPRAIEYLKGRGVSGEIAKTYGLGYAPEGWRSLASVFAEYDDPMLVEGGLVIVNEEEDKRYDRFRDRVMFPIRNVKGECIGFGGRVLGEGTPKYLNSPETPVFSKGRELYGLWEARNALREQGYVLVTEGYMDVVALAQLGFPNAVATLGTACTTDHVQKLFRFTDSVVFSFDGDAAGRRAARKALEGALPYATDVRTVKFLFLPPEHDPDSYIREFGHEAFQRYVSDATPLSRFLVEVAREGCDLATVEGRAHMAANAKPMWLQLPEGALRRQLLAELAGLAQLDAHELGELWTGKPARRAPWRPARGESAPARTRGRTLPVSRSTRALQILLSQPQAWERLSHDDHHLLCEMPAPHGALFAWLDSQHHDHGPQPWSALREALRGHEHESFAVAELAKLPPEIESDPAELEDILAKERQARRHEEMKRLAAAAAGDPVAFARYKALLEAQKPGRG
ncbi:MAG TPA: DNA primase [Ramlibacter sp.]|uniref:DNA primase n=1 Tax=Ramlibacter sp. TaxID=1917967 RepID=UPI002B770DF7|nr:DNA primase [Ramlibacter sp.]HVZ44443.1 DNA primase [Ramlibacter sp.]